MKYFCNFSQFIPLIFLLFKYQIYDKPFLFLSLLLVLVGSVHYLFLMLHGFVVLNRFMFLLLIRTSCSSSFLNVHVIYYVYVLVFNYIIVFLSVRLIFFLLIASCFCSWLGSLPGLWLGSFFLDHG